MVVRVPGGVGTEQAARGTAKVVEVRALEGVVRALEGVARV